MEQHPIPAGVLTVFLVTPEEPGSGADFNYLEASQAGVLHVRKIQVFPFEDG